MDKDPSLQPNSSEDEPSQEVSDATKKELLDAIRAKLSTASRGYTYGSETLDGREMAKEVYLKLEPSTVVFIKNAGDVPNRKVLNVPNLRVDSTYFYNPADLGNPPSETNRYDFFKQPDGTYLIEHSFSDSQKPGDWVPELPQEPVSSEVLSHTFKKALEPDDLERSMGLLKLTETQAQELLKLLRDAKPTNDPYNETTASHDPEDDEPEEDIEDTEDREDTDGSY